MASWMPFGDAALTDDGERDLRAAPVVCSDAVTVSMRSAL